MPNHSDERLFWRTYDKDPKFRALVNVLAPLAKQGTMDAWLKK